ncbi:hypothetical protein WICPIJ_008020 [Wickerhamomyces pijperi]|uniref:Uncharacterized protein n=1 Tax=Wickerhamomyces pijperi TaxID=599730 RepID=A0A9P8Q0K3_WICPI|nr:hypothetical protein WICPIJ_008020 [Wickerhamomyces pijperi]
MALIWATMASTIFFGPEETILLESEPCSGICNNLLYSLSSAPPAFSMMACFTEPLGPKMSLKNLELTSNSTVMASDLSVVGILDLDFNPSVNGNSVDSLTGLTNDSGNSLAWDLDFLGVPVFDFVINQFLDLFFGLSNTSGWTSDDHVVGLVLEVDAHVVLGLQSLDVLTVSTDDG